MKWIRKSYGYQCASDERLTIRQERIWSPAERRDSKGRWEVRLSRYRGNHFFSTLPEAKAWARQHWQPPFLNIFMPWSCPAMRSDPDAPAMLAAAIQGDEVAFGALLDWAVDQEILDPSNREKKVRQARKVGMISKKPSTAKSGSTRRGSIRCATASSSLPS
jgi:hypothetical protein